MEIEQKTFPVAFCSFPVDRPPFLLPHRGNNSVILFLNLLITLNLLKQIHLVLNHGSKVEENEN